MCDLNVPLLQMLSYNCLENMLIDPAPVDTIGCYLEEGWTAYYESSFPACKICLKILDLKSEY